MRQSGVNDARHMSNISFHFRSHYIISFSLPDKTRGSYVENPSHTKAKLF